MNRQIVRGFTTDDTTETAFAWSLTLIAKIMVAWHCFDSLHIVHVAHPRQAAVGNRANTPGNQGFVLFYGGFPLVTYSGFPGSACENR